jgi:type I restriction enzyme S subunit
LLSLAALGPDGYQSGQVKNALNTPGLRAATLNVGDLLISRANTVDAVGRVGIFSEEREDVSFPDTMMRLRLVPTVLAQFAEAVLSSPHGRAHMRRTAAGSATSMVKINRASLGRFLFPDAPVDMQRKIVGDLAAFDKARSQNELEHAALGDLKRAIVADVFGGSE